MSLPYITGLLIPHGISLVPNVMDFIHIQTLSDSDAGCSDAAKRYPPSVRIFTRRSFPHPLDLLIPHSQHQVQRL